MKKILLIIIALAMVSWGAFAQNVTIPDANFKAFLVGHPSINTNSDTEIQVSEAAAYTGIISCSSQSISDLTGIEAFVNITKLICQYNNLTNLDLSQNTALTEVNLTNNDLSTLNVSQCTDLTFLKFQGNNVSTIDLTNNTALTELYCNYNNLSTIDLSQNTALTFLAFNGNLFSTIDLSQNTAIEQMFSGENPNLTSLDLSNNTSLTTLTGNTYSTPGNLSTLILGQNPNLNIVDCENCGLTSLDVSQTPNTTYLGLSGNSLSAIDLFSNTALTTINLQYNNITALDLSNNVNLTSINCANNNNLSALNLKNMSTSTGLYLIGNPNLTCIEVDDVADATANWTQIDATASFSLDCDYPVYIPDANFKAYLVGNSAINTNSDSEIQMSEANAFTGAIDCSEQGIMDLTGIEAFTALIQLNCEDNNLSNLDVSQNTALTNLHCSYNNLSTLDLSQNTALTELRCEEANLSALDMSQNTLLTHLICKHNDLTSLDVTQNTLLFHLDCVGNSINTLDISQNTVLEEFYCNENTPLAELNMKNISTSVLTDFYAEDNPNLTCIEVDNVDNASTLWTNIDATASFSLDCNYPVYIPDANFKTYLVGNSNINTNSDTEIQSSEASAFAGTISCENKNISDLTGIEAFTSITGLFCGFNNLSSLDLSNNTALTDLFCGSNNLTSLDVSNNTELDYLRLDVNNISSLDVTNNVNLTYLRFNGNDISSIDLSNNIALTDLICYSSSLTELDLHHNVALTYLTAGGNNLSILNIANGNNSNMTGFSVTSNPNLTCIDVDDVAYSTSNWTNIDAGVSYSLNCQVDLVTSISVQGQGGASAISTQGGTLQMEASVLPTYADDATYTWSVTDGTGSATIDVNGLLTAVSDGTVTVTATANDGSGVTGDAEITISNQIVLVSSITVQGQAVATVITTDEGTLQMEATILPANADDATYTWSVTDGTGSATIDANGLLTAVSNGAVTVTATANDGSGVSSDVEITISNQIVLVNSITVQGQAGATAITTDEGTLQMEATILPANATDATYTWSVTDGTGSATIDANGLLTAVSNGAVTVTATANDGSGVTGDAEITISNQIVLVSSITVQGQAGATTITTEGGTLQMEATVLPANATDATYTWNVTNGTGEATIDASGLLTAITDGTITVIATANDGSDVTGSQTITISDQNVLGTNEKETFIKLKIYPNPASTQLSFTTNEKIEVITIIDIMGKTMETLTHPINTIDISNLAKGVYYMRIETDHDWISKKFIKE